MGSVLKGSKSGQISHLTALRLPGSTARRAAPVPRPLHARAEQLRLLLPAFAVRPRFLGK